ncbi:MAG TPA: fused MFS/spermidine synthase [Vicinamibacterales bacterium]|nr:fused MFS/spermidine synthase [Vicinamibacterales bacterium]
MARLLILFFFSGCAALIYETVWFYLVQLVVGASSLSVAVTLSSFMGGMALGSWLVPKLTPSHLHPLRVVAILEAGIALFGAAIPLALPYIQQAYMTVAEPGANAIALRAIVCTLVLVPPTMLMGATLPAIARWRSSEDEAGSVGLLYMANLAGGATGTVLAGFYLLRVHDTVIATYVAVAINVLIAVACFLWAGKAARAGEYGEEKPSPALPDLPALPASIYVASGLSGLTALGAEVVWTRQLSLLFGASVYTFSLILAVFLAGLGIGGFAGSKIARRATSPLTMLATTQMLLAIAIAYGAWAIVNLLPAWQPRAAFLPAVWKDPAYAFAFDGLRCAVAMLPATLLWGASFPLTLACAERQRHSADADFSTLVARINATNTLGSLTGAIAFTLVGIPMLGSHVAQQVLVALAGVSSAVLVWMTAARVPRLAAAVVTVAVAALVVPAVPSRLIAYGRSVDSWDSIKSFLYLAEGATASVAVTEGVGGAKQFHIAGKVEASDMDLDMRLERMLGHMPALVHPNPKSVLIVGVGAGVTAGALSIHPEIERIVVCEIEPMVPRSARAFFGKENHHVFDDPRVQVVFDDARHFLQTTDEKFDIITSDPIHPWVRGAATLYSVEYLTLVKNHLNPGGVVTQWIPLYETDLASAKSQIGTFASVFPDTTLWNPDLLEEGYDLVALGRVQEAPIREEAIRDRLNAAPRVKQSLYEVMLRSPEAIISTYAGRGKDLAPWLADAQINRERNLRLQYLAGMAANTDNRFLIFQSMLQYRRYPADLFVASASLEEQLRGWYDR